MTETPDKEKYSLRKLIHENQGLLTAIGIFAALSAYFSTLVNPLTNIAIFPMLLFILVSWELLEYTYEELNLEYTKKGYPLKIVYFALLFGAFILSILNHAWQNYTVQMKSLIIFITTFLIYLQISIIILRYFNKKMSGIKNIYAKGIILIAVLIITWFCIPVFFLYTTDILLAYFKIDKQLLTIVQQYLT